MTEPLNPEQTSVATKEQNEKFLKQREEFEAYYKSLVEAHQYEHAYVKMMSEMAEYELRNKMAIMKLAQLEAEMQRNKEEAGKAKPTKADA